MIKNKKILISLIFMMFITMILLSGCNKADNKTAEEIESLILEANTELEQGKYDEAYDHFNEAKGLGYKNEEINRLMVVIKDYNKALELKGDEASDILNNLDSIYLDFPIKKDVESLKENIKNDKEKALEESGIVEEKNSDNVVVEREDKSNVEVHTFSPDAAIELCIDEFKVDLDQADVKHIKEGDQIINNQVWYFIEIYYKGTDEVVTWHFVNSVDGIVSEGGLSIEGVHDIYSK